MINKMKRLLFCAVLLLTSWVNVYCQSGQPQDSLILSPKDSILIDYLNSFHRQLKEPMYELYPTSNMWNFLKLNTCTGAITIVQFSTDRKNRFEYDLDLSDKNYSWEKPICGRFKLVPTQNNYTFLLLDQIDGRVWQVQWGFKDNECFAVRIY